MKGTISVCIFTPLDNYDYPYAFKCLAANDDGEILDEQTGLCTLLENVELEDGSILQAGTAVRPSQRGMYSRSFDYQLSERQLAAICPPITLLLADRTVCRLAKNVSVIRVKIPD